MRRNPGDKADVIVIGIFPGAFVRGDQRAAAIRVCGALALRLFVLGQVTLRGIGDMGRLAESPGGALPLRPRFRLGTGQPQGQEEADDAADAEAGGDDEDIAEPTQDRVVDRRSFFRRRNAGQRRHLY